MKTLLLLVILFLFPIVYAEQSISLDKSSYALNDSIKISGKVTFRENAFVIVQIRSPSDIVAIDQFVPNPDGSFSRTFSAQGQKWTESGQYAVIITYGGEKYQKTFDFISSEVNNKVTNPIKPEEIREKELPSWVKSYAKKWHDGDISDRQFLAGVSELIKDKYVDVDEKFVKENDDTRLIPDWFRNTAIWYYDGLIEDKDYFLSLKFLIENKFLVI